jgi:predicted acetyltransferase
MPDPNLKKPLFELGQTVATPGAIEALQQAGISAASLLRRHQCGDWGDLEDEDLSENKRALNQWARIFSSYQITEATKIWVITEADRSVTTVLLPEDY